MQIPQLLVGGLIAGLAANVTGYVITARLFHAYQAKTPATWRSSETGTHYFYAVAIRIAACIGIGFLYAVLEPAVTFLPSPALVHGLGFGALLWSVTLLPLVAEVALFINWHRGFVMGLLLDWLVVCMLAGAAAALTVGQVH